MDTIDRTRVGSPPGERVPRQRRARLKRAVLGRPLPTAVLAEERLGKVTGLAIFASDNLSSVAYATEEILKVVVPVAGLAAFGIVMPITFAMVGVLAVLVFSYRQTIKAYPSAGGAYIVTKDNLGLLAAQVAGVSLLTDYVLTVAVSTAAGIAAIISAFPALSEYRVWMAVVAIWVIAWGNLRGVRESGTLFAIPTYFFIAMMFTLLGTGIVRVLSGDLGPLPVSAEAASATGAITLVVALRAFASGGAAVTGVEAISNGVSAFRRPEWRNARTTLVWMASLLAVMFLGLSFLAVRLHVVPTESATVVAQVGRAVFGGGTVGFVLFLMLQIGTTLILILAANTSFAGFPRLASFQAADRYMPRQLTTRGHRLVYSNGIVALAAVATLLVVLFRADVHRLIPLYAIGVFASFTLSQAGMARRHVRLREQGWRAGLAVNLVGAATTAAVTLIVGVTKFTHGAWAVVLLVPIAVVMLLRLNRIYERERKELDEDLPRFRRAAASRPVVVVVVRDVSRSTLHALQYAKTIRAARIVAVYPHVPSARTLAAAWERIGAGVPIEALPERDTGAGLARYVRSFAPDQEVNVILPAPATTARIERLRRGRTGARLARALLPIANARLTVVRDHPGPGHPVVVDEAGRPQVRVLPRRNHRAVVLVDRVDRAAIAAIRYAVSIGADEVRAVHAVADPDRQEKLIERWMTLGLPVELDLIECWDRNVPRALEEYVSRLSGSREEVTVVMPRRDFATLRQRVLHDRTSRRIARTLGRQAHVDVSVVPYYFGPR